MNAVADPETVATPPIISDFIQRYWIQDWLMWMLLVQISSKHATSMPVIATEINYYHFNSYSLSCHIDTDVTCLLKIYIHIL